MLRVITGKFWQVFCDPVARIAAHCAVGMHIDQARDHVAALCVDLRFSAALPNPGDLLIERDTSLFKPSLRGENFGIFNDHYRLPPDRFV